MATAALKANQDILDIIAKSDIDDTGLTLTGQLDRKQYEAVNKFLELAGAKWNRAAKRHMFQSGAKAKLDALLGSGEIVDEKKQYQAFYTPAAIAAALVETAGIKPGMSVLEPSAGEGAIALAARDAGAEVWCIELNPAAREALKGHGFRPNHNDFLTVEPQHALLVDRVLMNPPFTNDQDVKHVMHAFRFLKPGGSLYAIMSPGFQWGDSRRVRSAFRDLVSNHGRVAQELPPGTFSESGTEVRTVIVELHRTRES